MDIPTAAALMLGIKVVGPSVGNVAEDFAKRLLGPAMDASGVAIAAPINQFNQRRAQRFSRLIAVASETLSDRQVEVQPVPDHLLLPLIQHGSLIEDSDLQVVWAQMIASASAGLPSSAVLPSFPSILSELSALDVQVLGRTHQALLHSEKSDPYNRVDLGRIYKELKIEFPANQIVEDNLLRLRLVEPGEPRVKARDLERAVAAIMNPRSWGSGDLDVQPEWPYFVVSSLGWAFMQACAGPQSEKPAD